MSVPRDPGRDLSLERLDGRDGQRPAYLAESAKVASSLAGAASASDYQTIYEALIDAVFTAPGVREWLLGLRRAMEARFAGKEEAPRPVVEPATSEAIRKAGFDSRRP